MLRHNMKDGQQKLNLSKKYHHHSLFNPSFCNAQSMGMLISSDAVEVHFLLTEVQNPWENLAGHLSFMAGPEHLVHGRLLCRFLHVLNEVLGSHNNIDMWMLWYNSLSPWKPSSYKQLQGYHCYAACCRFPFPGNGLIITISPSKQNEDWLWTTGVAPLGEFDVIDCQFCALRMSQLEGLYCSCWSPGIAWTYEIQSSPR